MCEYEREKFARILGVSESSIRLIRNGSDPLPVDESAPSIDGDPLLVSVGRLEEYKGHHRILRAMPEILKQAPGARLAVVGSGPFEQQLRDMATEFGVAEQVSFEASAPEERGGLGKLVSDADVFCLLSAYEAHPIAVMEAVGAGTKAAVADTSGLSELGREGLATVVPLELPPSELATACWPWPPSRRSPPTFRPGTTASISFASWLGVEAVTAAEGGTARCRPQVKQPPI